MVQWNFKPREAVSHFWVTVHLLHSCAVSERQSFRKRFHHLVASSVYLHDLLHYHQPARTLKSTSQLLYLQLYQPATRTSVQSKAFSIMAPPVWNFLSPITKSYTTITTFKAHLKTELFSAAVHMPRSDISSAAGASDLNSSTHGSAYNCFWQWDWHWHFCSFLTPRRTLFYYKHGNVSWQSRVIESSWKLISLEISVN